MCYLCVRIKYSSGGLYFLQESLQTDLQQKDGHQSTSVTWLVAFTNSRTLPEPPPLHKLMHTHTQTHTIFAVLLCLVFASVHLH